jgi:hypothetical protein
MDYCIDLFDPTALGEVTKKQGGVPLYRNVLVL